MTLRAHLDLHRGEARVFTRQELLRASSNDALGAAVSRGDLVRLAPGLYAAGLHAESWTVRAVAAGLWAGAGAALTGRAALAAWGIVDEPPHVIDVVVPEGRHRTAPHGVRIRSTSHMPWRGEWRQGVAIVEAAAAVVHAFALEPEAGRAEFIYSMVRRRALRTDGVREVLAAVPRVTARPALLRLLDHADLGVESYLEERSLAQSLTRRRFPGLVRQHRVRVAGFTFRIDAYDEASRTAFELDGAGTHGTADARERDLVRDALLATQGIQTVRFSYRDVTRRPAWCADVAAQVIAQRGGSVQKCLQQPGAA